MPILVFKIDRLQVRHNARRLLDHARLLVTRAATRVIIIKTRNAVLHDMIYMTRDRRHAEHQARTAVQTHTEAQKVGLARAAAFCTSVCISLSILQACKVLSKLHSFTVAGFVCGHAGEPLKGEVSFKSDLATACCRVSSAARHRRQKLAIFIDFTTPVMAFVSGARACSRSGDK